MIAAEQQTRLDLPLVEKGNMEQWFGEVLQVVADSVDRSTTCFDDTCEFCVRHPAVVSRDEVNDVYKVFVLPDQFDVFIHWFFFGLSF